MREVMNQPLFMRRRVVVAIENDSIGEGLFVTEVSKTLRVLADLMEAGKAGNEGSEAYLLGGTLVTLKADDINAVSIHGQTPDTQSLAAFHEPAPS